MKIEITIILLISVVFVNCSSSPAPSAMYGKEVYDGTFDIFDEFNVVIDSPVKDISLPANYSIHDESCTITRIDTGSNNIAKSDPYPDMPYKKLGLMTINCSAPYLFKARKFSFDDLNSYGADRCFKLHDGYYCTMNTDEDLCWMAYLVERTVRDKHRCTGNALMVNGYMLYEVSSDAVHDSSYYSYTSLQCPIEKSPPKYMSYGSQATVYDYRQPTVELTGQPNACAKLQEELAAENVRATIVHATVRRSWCIFVCNLGDTVSAMTDRVNKLEDVQKNFMSVTASSLGQIKDAVTELTGDFNKRIDFVQSTIKSSVDNLQAELETIDRMSKSRDTILVGHINSLKTALSITTSMIQRGNFKSMYLIYQVFKEIRHLSSIHKIPSDFLFDPSSVKKQVFQPGSKYMKYLSENDLVNPYERFCKGELYSDCSLPGWKCDYTHNSGKLLISCKIPLVRSPANIMLIRSYNRLITPRGFKTQDGCSSYNHYMLPYEFKSVRSSNDQVVCESGPIIGNDNQWMSNSISNVLDGKTNFRLSNFETCYSKSSITTIDRSAGLDWYANLEDVNTHLARILPAQSYLIPGQHCMGDKEIDLSYFNNVYGAYSQSRLILVYDSGSSFSVNGYYMGVLGPGKPTHITNVFRNIREEIRLRDPDYNLIEEIRVSNLLNEFMDYWGEVYTWTKSLTDYLKDNGSSQVVFSMQPVNYSRYNFTKDFEISRHLAEEANRTAEDLRGKLEGNMNSIFDMIDSLNSDDKLEDSTKCSGFDWFTCAFQTLLQIIFVVAISAVIAYASKKAWTRYKERKSSLSKNLMSPNINDRNFSHETPRASLMPNPLFAGSKEDPVYYEIKDSEAESSTSATPELSNILSLKASEGIEDSTNSKNNTTTDEPFLSEELDATLETTVLSRDEIEKYRNLHGMCPFPTPVQELEMIRVENEGVVTWLCPICKYPAVHNTQIVKSYRLHKGLGNFSLAKLIFALHEYPHLVKQEDPIREYDLYRDAGFMNLIITKAKLLKTNVDPSSGDHLFAYKSIGKCSWNYDV